MIGIILHEDGIIFEFKPIFAKSNIGFSFRISKIVSDKWWGEYGISFSSHDTVWWHWKHTTLLYYPFDFIQKWAKEKR